MSTNKCGITSSFLFLLLISAVLLALPHQLDAKEILRVYPAPAEEPISRQFTLRVQDQSVPVYLATIIRLSAKERETLHQAADPATTTKTSFATFDIAGPVEVSVTCPGEVHAAKILPSIGITPNISGNHVTFTISKPEKLTLEINGDWIHSLHLFANPFETDAPSPNDPNVIYFGPGAHEIPPTTVGSGKTVYIAGGAVVYGKIPTGAAQGPIFFLNGSNITLRGRGIIDGSRYAHHTGSILIATGSNIHVEGVILRDSSGWTFPVRKSDHIDINNIKIFGWRGNSDGIDICNSQHVNVLDCFIRTFDDLVVIKTDDKTAGPSRDITVKQCVLWNEIAHSLSLGAELRQPVENVLFTDCDVIHDKGREWELRVYNCDSAPVRHIVFENIRIEECRKLFSLWIGKAVWSKENERGHIDDIIFRNITSAKPDRPGSPAELKGFDANHAIHHVLFDNVRIGGEPMQSSDVQENKFVSDVRIKP